MAVGSPNRINGNSHTRKVQPSPSAAQPEPSVPTSDLIVKEVQDHVHAFCSTSLIGVGIAAQESQWESRKTGSMALPAEDQAKEKAQIKSGMMKLRKDKKMWQDTMKQDLLAVISSAVQAILPDYVQNAIQEHDQNNQNQGHLDNAAISKLLDERDALWEAKFRAMRSELKDELQAESSKVHEVLTTVVQRTGNAPSSPILSKDPRSSFRGLNGSTLSDEQLDQKITQGVAAEVEPIRNRLDEALRMLDEMRGRVNLMRGNVLPGMGDKLAKHEELLKKFEKQIDGMGSKIAAHTTQLENTDALFQSIKEIQEGLKTQGSLSGRVQALEVNATARSADADKLESAIELARQTTSTVMALHSTQQHIQERLNQTPTIQDLTTVKTTMSLVQQRLAQTPSNEDLTNIVNTSASALRERQANHTSEFQAIRKSMAEDYQPQIVAAHQAITYLHQSLHEVRSRVWFDKQLKDTVQACSDPPAIAIEERLTRFEMATSDTMMRIFNWLMYLQTATPGA